jgi:hypothetical protein
MKNKTTSHLGKGFLCLLLCLFVFSGLAYSAEFSADIKLINSQGEFSGKAFVKGMKIRHEYTKGAEREILIYRLDQGIIWMLQPSTMMYMEMPNMGGDYNDPEFEESIKEMAEKIYLGEEMLNGYLCDKYEYRYYNPDSGTLFMWHAKKLDYPIKVDYSASGFSMYTEYKNITEGGVPDSLFELPSGYTKMPGYR